MRQNSDILLDMLKFCYFWYYVFYKVKWHIVGVVRNVMHSHGSHDKFTSKSNIERIFQTGQHFSKQWTNCLLLICGTFLWFTV